MGAQATVRRYYLDWIRVMVILTVFVYHSTRFFNLGDWHVKNPTTYGAVEIFENVLETWMMPLAFLVSGASVFYALGKSGVGSFIKDKVLRLLVPLVVGIFTHSALQIYLERVSKGQFSGSFFEFYPHYFDGLYGFGGNLGWMGVHLWYVEMLFVFSLILLPVMLLLRRGPGQCLVAGLTRALAVPGLVFLLVIPAIVFRNLPGDSVLGMDVWGGWGIASHAWFFLSGFVIASSERVQQSIQRLRWVWLGAAILLTATQVIAALPHPGEYENVELQAYLWMFAFLGVASRYLNVTTPRLQYANEAVLPFYILHQPVLIVIGFFVVQWTVPDLVKYLIIAPTSFVVIAAIYELLVRRFNLLRILFGMKALQPAPVLQLRPGTVPSH